MLSTMNNLHLHHDGGSSQLRPGSDHNLGLSNLVPVA
jgi:hypothetical protein